MKVTIQNNKIFIEKCEEATLKHLNEILSYKDKSKDYALRKMLARNPSVRHTPYYKNLAAKSEGSLLEMNGDVVEIPSGFAHIIQNLNPVDLRHDTGIDIALPWANKAPDLRPYQQEAVDIMEQNYRGLVNFATGLGKTLTAVHLVRKMKKRALIVCPSEAIASNFYSELSKYFGEQKVGMFGGGKKQIKDITVGIAQSVNNHVDKFAKHDLGLVVFDEVHHIAADTFFNIGKHLGGVGRMFGLTATDFRSDGKDVMITASVGRVLIKRDIIWGIDNGWLANPAFIMKHVPTTGRDFPSDKLKNYKEHVLNSEAMNDQIISDIQKFLAAGKKVLCLVDEIAHGQKISEAIGLPFAHGKDKESDKYIQQLNDGKIPGLIGSDSKIGEGCDTRLVDVLVLANFVASKGPLWQNIGRGLRLYPGKTMLIVRDYCPTGSKMLKRHAQNRIKIYKEITDNVKET